MTEKEKSYFKEYNEKNKEEIKVKKKKYYEANKEKVKNYNKDYRQNNKERIKNQTKEYRETNKEYIKIYRKTLKPKFSFYKASAKKRNIEFKLTLEEFEFFWQKNCYYCNRSIDTIGLDRIDSSIGYIPENIRSCCARCNTMKLDSTEEQWYEDMLLILKNLQII